MSLKERIETDMKRAMLDKNKDDLRALRGIKSLILLAETEKGSSGTLAADVEMKLLQKAAKQRQESIEIYRSSGHEDLATAEQIELEVIRRYMPQQLSEQQLKNELLTIIRESGASGARDMGVVMGIATKKLAGKADGKALAEMVKNLLTTTS